MFHFLAGQIASFWWVGVFRRHGPIHEKAGVEKGQRVQDVSVHVPVVLPQVNLPGNEVRCKRNDTSLRKIQTGTISHLEGMMDIKLPTCWVWVKWSFVIMIIIWEANRP